MGVGVGVMVGVAVAVGVGPGVGVGVTVGVAVAVGVGPGVGVGVMVGVAVAVGVGPGVGVGVMVGVAVAVGVGPGSGVTVGVAVAVGVGPGGAVSGSRGKVSGVAVVSGSEGGAVAVAAASAVGDLPPPLEWAREVAGGIEEPPSAAADAAPDCGVAIAAGSDGDALPRGGGMRVGVEVGVGVGVSDRRKTAGSSWQTAHSTAAAGSPEALRQSITTQPASPPNPSRANSSGHHRQPTICGRRSVNRRRAGPSSWVRCNVAIR